MANVPPALLDYSDDLIRRVLTSVRTIAMVGATDKPDRPAFFVFKYLQTRGFRVIPINPGRAGGTICGEMVHARLADVPVPIDMVDIFRNSEAAAGVVDEALALTPRPKVIWMQLTVRHDEAAARAEAAGMTVIMDRCPKIEYARISGESGWQGINSRLISARRQTKDPSGTQRLALGPGANGGKPRSP